VTASGRRGHVCPDAPDACVPAAHDALAGLWRARRVQMVERQIGTKSGTGGSTGAPYLRKRVPLRYYPLLWELRDHL
jgi:tryptophan 2,3-dioxygenase